MVSWLATLFRKDEFLMQLFPGPYTGIDNRNIDLRAKSPHADHLAGKIIDTNTLPHLQHENVPAFRVTGGLDDEAGCLRNVHEIAGHIRVGNGDRTAKIDLPRKGWDDATTAAKHVSKPDGRALSHALTGLAVAVATCNQHLSNAFRRTHHRMRLNGFIR